MNTQVHPYETSENPVGTTPALSADRQNIQLFTSKNIQDITINEWRNSI